MDNIEKLNRLSELLDCIADYDSLTRDQMRELPALTGRNDWPTDAAGWPDNNGLYDWLNNRMIDAYDMLTPDQQTAWGDRPGD